MKWNKYNAPHIQYMTHRHLPHTINEMEKKKWLDSAFSVEMVVGRFVPCNFVEDTLEFIFTIAVKIMIIILRKKKKKQKSLR